MAITFEYQKADYRLADEDAVRRWIGRVVKSRGCRVGSIGYLFCSDDYLLEANIKYLSHDTYTDIITFDYVEGNIVSGDMMISVDRVEENAAKFSVSAEHELRRVIIHGVLHLLGQGDKSEEDAREMRRQEEEALRLWQTAE